MKNPEKTRSRQRCRHRGYVPWRAYIIIHTYIYMYLYIYRMAQRTLQGYLDLLWTVVTAARCPHIYLYVPIYRYIRPIVTYSYTQGGRFFCLFKYLKHAHKHTLYTVLGLINVCVCAHRYDERPTDRWHGREDYERSSQHQQLQQCAFYIILCTSAAAELWSIR